MRNDLFFIDFIVYFSSEDSLCHWPFVVMVKLERKKVLFEFEFDFDFEFEFDFEYEYEYEYEHE